MKKLKLWDKLKALEMLMKYHGLLKEVVEVHGSLAERIVRARRQTKRSGTNGGDSIKP